MQTSHAITDPLFPDCPVRNVLARVCDKWSVLIMHTLISHAGPMRFSELRRSLPDISQKVLTKTLRTLEEDGYLHRQVFPEVPPRVEYRLTARGASFMEASRPMIDWAIENLAAIVNERARHIG